MNLVKPVSKCPAARTTFYVFEIAALVYFAIELIMAICTAAIAQMFTPFISGLCSATFFGLVLYGLGRVIDLLCANKADCPAQTTADKKENEE